MSSEIRLDHHNLDSQADLLSQIECIRSLHYGWHDGDGLAPSSHMLNQISAWLDESHLLGAQPPPRLYPTPEGGVEAEWLIGRLDLSIEFEPNSYTVHWHAMDLDRNKVEEDTVPLHDTAKLQALGQKLEAALAASESLATDGQEAGTR
jgi:hypothetical protein